MEIETRLVRKDIGNVGQGSFIDTEYVMHIVYDGTFLFQNQQDTYYVEPQDVIIIPPNILHALRDVQHVHMLVIHFYDHSQTIEGLDLYQIISLGSNMFDPIRRLSAQLHEIWSEDLDSKQYIADGLVQTIVGYYISFAGFSTKKSRNEDQFYNWKSVKLAVQYMRARCDDLPFYL